MEIRPSCVKLLSSLRVNKSSLHRIKGQVNNFSLRRSIVKLSTASTRFNNPDVNASLPKKRLDGLPGFIGVEEYRDKVAITDQGADYSYEDIYMRSYDLAKGLIGLMKEEWTNQKICILCDTGLSHVITTWACWMLGNVIIPLPIRASRDRLEHLIRDCGATTVITTKSQADLVNPITREADLRLIALDNSWWKSPETQTNKSGPLPLHFVDNEVYQDGTAMVLYTAGRSGQPKGILLSHSTINNQINSVVDSWDISAEDTILHCLNLHQMYGLVNSLYAPLTQRARVLTMNSFNEAKVWSHLLGVNKSNPVTVFPGTPCIYNKLLQSAGDIFKDKKSKEYAKSSCTKKIRLMTSSSTSMPEHLSAQWKTLTGHRILNNYICTEAGLVLSNRVGGSAVQQGPRLFECGFPVDGMEVRLVRFRDHTKSAFDVLLEENESGIKVLDETAEDNKNGIIGELLVRGANAATRYWSGEKEVELKTHNGWLPTGDILQYNAGSYTVKGKLNIRSVEVGGEFVNALDLERKLLACTDVQDCTVLGLGDTNAEQQIAAVIVVHKTKKITLNNILDWCNQNMGPNMVPAVLKIVEDIPRDDTGHVDKFKIFALFPEVPILCFHDTKL